ncbi:MAG: hypothetical protein WAV38_15575 [Xanthobacteraceae bacterium]|jgi:hypothetical protein
MMADDTSFPPLPVPRPGSRRPASPKAGRIFLQPIFLRLQSPPGQRPLRQRRRQNWTNLVHNSLMSIPEQQIPPIEERIGSMVGKIIVLALCAVLLWGYSTTFLAQIGLF